MVLPVVGTCIYFRDGSAFLAVRRDFEDLQLSPAGWGATPSLAVDDLVLQEQRAKKLGFFGTTSERE